jgi:hypothetical protein
MSAEDFIRGLDLPVTIAGCELVPAPDQMFDIRSRGPLTQGHGTRFDADADTARIVSVTGWLGRREPGMPPNEHIEALRELGFARMIVRSGKQYELG